MERLYSQAGSLQDKTFLALLQWFSCPWWLWMDPMVQLDKTAPQMHSFLPLPPQTGVQTLSEEHLI